MTSITEATLLHHVCIVLLLLWALNFFQCCHPFAYFFSFVYLYLVHERYVMRLWRKLQFEGKRYSNQRRVLTDSETVRWLNYAIEKIWLVCMEDIVSQKILLPIIPWFMQKYKPWTVKETSVQHLYLGRSPPMFTDIRVLRNSTGDDHLVLELGMNFRTADDMSAILAVKLRKRLGLGMWAKLHLLGMHVEGKVLVGVKFLRTWPFLGRLRVCFVVPPYFQMTVKPIFSHGLDVTELPGIAGWLDKLLALAFEQTLVEPNMLVVDMEKFVSPQAENWFSVNAKEPIAYAIVEVIEATDMKPSDLNGLADPYVKGRLGPYRFRSKTQKKTLAPKWHEEFKIPIITWESPNLLDIEVRDKDRFVDDTLGECSINIGDFRDGQRHDMWLSLQNIKMGRLHLAVTVSEGSGKVSEHTCDGEQGAEHKNDAENLVNEHESDTFGNDEVDKVSSSTNRSPKVADTYEPIDVEGQRETGIWVHHPGSEVAQVWEPRKGKSRLFDGEIHSEGGASFKLTASATSHNDGCSTDESVDGSKTPSQNPFRRGFRKIGSIFNRSPRDEDKSSYPEEPISSPHENLRSLDSKEIGVKFIVEEIPVKSPTDDFPAKSPKEDGKGSQNGDGQESPRKGNVKDMAKNILKQAGKSAHGLKHALSRKTSRKSKAESGSLQRHDSVQYDSSGSESPASSVDTTPQVESVSLDCVTSVSETDPFQSTGHVIQTPKDATSNCLEPMKEINVTTERKTGGDSEGNENMSKTPRITKNTSVDS